MIKLSTITVVLLLPTFFCRAQLPDISKVRTDTAKLEVLRVYINKMNAQENSKESVKASRLAWQIAQRMPGNSKKSLYSYFMGAAYEFSSQYDSAVYYHELSFVYAQKTGQLNRQFEALERLQVLYYEMGNKQKNDSIIAIIEPLALQTKQKEIISKAYGLLGNYYEAEHSYQKAIDYMLKRLTIIRKSPPNQESRENEAVVLVNIGNAHNEMGNYRLGLFYLSQSIPLLKTYQYGLSVSFSNMAGAYRGLQKPDSSFSCLQKSLKIAKEIQAEDLLPRIYSELGNYYQQEKQYNTSEKYLRQALAIGQKLQMNHELIKIHYIYGELTQSLKRYEEARTHFQKALEMATGVENKGLMRDSYGRLAKLEKETGHFSEAYHYLELSNTYKDSIQQESSTRAIAEMETKYQTQRKQEEILLLNRQNKIQQLQLGIERRNQILLLVGALLLTIIGVLLYHRYRLRKRAELEKIRSGIAADFHDELGATLSSIAIYSEIASHENETNPQKMKPLLKMIADSSRSTVSTMNDMVWSIKPDNDTMATVLYRIQEFALPLLESKNIVFDFKVDAGIENLIPSMTQRKNIFLIFKEAINNAAKYANATRVEVELNYQNKQFRLFIKDNGIGFDSQTVKRGNGLKNMEKRAAEINGELITDSTLGKGTCLTLTCKLT
jgi:signal transduction histidine kinase